MLSFGVQTFTVLIPFFHLSSSPLPWAVHSIQSPGFKCSQSLVGPKPEVSDDGLTSRCLLGWFLLPHPRKNSVALTFPFLGPSCMT